MKHKGPLSTLLFDADEQCPLSLLHFIEKRLTVEEARTIWQQLLRTCAPNRQVLWTGMPRESAQTWADAHNMQTLVTVMGPFMNPKDPLCPARQKSHSAWIDYIHGASALFALRITKGEHVLVLSHPPPDRFRPDGNSGFQCIEAPIITGKLGNHAVQRIDIVHPYSEASSSLVYQFWPHDCVSLWLHRFGTPDDVMEWKTFKGRKTLRPLSDAWDIWFRQSEMNNVTSIAARSDTTHAQHAGPFDNRMLSECGLHPLQA